MMKRAMMVVLVVVAAGAGPARADVKVQERTQLKLTGALGVAQRLLGAKDPVTHTVAVRGDRKLTLEDGGGELIDLAEEKVFRLDPKAKTYKVTTFEELRKQMKAAEEDAKREAKEPKDAKAGKDPRAKELEVDLDVKQTGQKKVINGFDTQQAIITVTIRTKGQTLEEGGGTVITADTWLTRKVAARDEISAFDMRYLKKLYGEDSARAMMGAFSALAATTVQGLGPGMEKLRSASGKLEGYPISTSTLVESVRSAAELAPKQEEEAPSGGLGGFLAKTIAKKVLDKKVEPRETLLTSTHEVMSITPSVSDADVALPPGLKEKK
jgi:hypothetical protein